jgi:RNA polymerase sigma factor (sigma-70 family)
MSALDSHDAIDAVWRMEAAKVIGGLTRIVRDVGLAEDLAQEALVVALEKWPIAGIPPNPGAWLMATAKHRALDHFRAVERSGRKHEELSRELERTPPDRVSALDDPIGDDVLRLIFIACHPVLSTEARAALTPRVVGGLTTDEIARAFLVPEPTIAQRIVRAKRTLAQKQIPFAVPRGLDLSARLASVLEVIYLIFILLMDQNRALWDRLLIGRGLAALERADALTSVKGPYRLQAEIAACHARAAAPEQTNWGRIVALYNQLAEIAQSPIVDLNRAVAVSWHFGPQAALDLLEPLLEDPAMKNYHLLPSVRGDLLAQLGRHREAQAEFERAAGMTLNAREQKLLKDRAEASTRAAEDSRT